MSVEYLNIHMCKVRKLTAPPLPNNIEIAGPTHSSLFSIYISVALLREFLQLAALPPA